MINGTLKRKYLAIGLGLALAVYPVVSSAQRGGDAEIEREFRFAAALIDADYPEYAEAIVDALLAAHPDVTDVRERANVIRAQAMVARRRFEEAERFLNELPPDSPRARAIRLAMADGYYLMGNYEACTAIYEDFFAQYDEELPEDPDLLRFFAEAAYQYAQMLILRDDPVGAAAAYAHVLRAIDPAEREMRRTVMVERSELLLRAAEDLPPGEERQAKIDQAIEHCREVLWGGMDLWFGRAVICLAQTYILSDDRDTAIELLQTNLRMLRTVDDLMRDANIPLTESPLAGARSLLARLYIEEADLLVGERGAREARGLGYLRQAYDAYESIWRMIRRGNQRDAQWLERNPGRTVADLPSRREADRSLDAPTLEQERRAPFTNLAAALERFRQRLDAVGGVQGWSEANRQTATDLREKTVELIETIRTYEGIRIGVTPSREMDVGERFRGREALERAAFFLGDEEDRKQSAVRRYTQALQHDYHVFVNYAGSPWARQSGERVDGLKSTLENLTGQTVRIEVGAESRLRSGLAMITQGRTAFRQSNYAEAVERFVDGLNIRPTGDHVMGVLANLIDAYSRLEKPLYVRMLAEYIGERFGDHAMAPTTLLRIARFYYDRDDPDMYLDLYERYLQLFPNHYMASTILFMLGEQRWEVKDFEHARGYYRRVVDNYPQSGEFMRALNRIGWSYYLQDQFAEAADVFEQVAERAQPGMLRAEAKLSLADSLRQTGQYMQAIRHYRELSRWLEDRGSIYRATAAAREQSERLLEQAMFFQGHCLSRVEEPEDRIEEFRQGAVTLFREFVTRFPRSELAPLALGSTGAVLLALEQADAAADVYDELARNYPESEAGRDARFAMIRSLLDIGQMRRAREELTAMIEDADRHTASQFLRLGRIFSESRDHPSAIRALDRAVAKLSDDAIEPDQRRAMDQRARMLLGQSHFAQGNHDETVRHVRHLIDNYPASAMFFEARFLLGRAYQSLGRIDEAVETLRDVFRQAQDQLLINRATLLFAELQAGRGETSEALASFQRIVLLENPEDPEVRPMFEQALASSVGLFVELGRWNDAVESADQYLRLFPSGADAVDVRNWRVQAVMQREGGNQ